ncbi:hypothetical protein OTU49_006468, partial [Cherax quadricarinatus]
SMLESERSAAQLVIEEWKRPAHGTQYFAALSASMGAMAVGAAIGYSSPASAAFRYDNTTEVITDNSTFGNLYLSKEARGWFAGSLSIGALLGCMLAGLCINNIGRKGTMLVSVVPLLSGWILIGLAQNLSMLVIGRILCGLCTGISSLVVPTYTTEFASKDIRGALGTGFQLFITVGILYAYIFGWAMDSWRLLTVVCGALGFVFLLMAAFLKESPHYLLSKGKEMQARQSMQYFRGELFYPNVKEAAGSLATTINWTCVFIVTFTFEPLQGAIHDYGVYWLFGSISALNFIFCLAFVPETKGKTLQETTAYFGGPPS